MTTILVKTNSGLLLETIQIDDTMIEDLAQDDHIHTMIRDALIAAAKIQTRRDRENDREIENDLLIADIYAIMEHRK